MAPYGYGKYVPVAVRKAKAIKSFEKLKKKNPDIEPIIIEGRKLAKTWWGEAWNDNLESYSDYSNRLPRGHSYVRHRAILDLQITSTKITAQGKGLFPSPEEISFDCSCPDYAVMCKHVAATLYGTGSRLDQDPALFFTLHDINIDQFISRAIDDKSESLLQNSDKKSNRVIEDDDLSSMFDIDLDNEEK